MNSHTLKSNSLTAIISTDGAELHSLKMTDGTELIWQADAAYWGRHAPHLFPIVGRLPDDTLTHKNKDYRMTQHGFARDMPFEIEQSSNSECTFLLRDNEQTLEKYPFHFEFRVIFSLQDDCLSISYNIKNTGDEILPCSVGAHPAFVWPLPGNSSRENHHIEFTETETCDINRLDAGLVKKETSPWPWANENNGFTLADSLFEPDAMIFTEHYSREVSYSGEQGPSITVKFDDFPHLGIWSVPSAGFVCIEPWQGHSSEVGSAGEFSDKTGLAKIKPNEERSWTMSVIVTD
ncbi:MAG: aldose 1-epimerase family protein [Sulfuriflexus sp.]|nr:aldose 1-epimerase family protein [Sulfuriflexus sp.]